MIKTLDITIAIAIITTWLITILGTIVLNQDFSNVFSVLIPVTCIWGFLLSENNE